MGVLQASEGLLRCRLGAEAQEGSVRKGPLARGLAELGPCSPQAFPCRGFGTFAQPAIGENILAPGEPMDSMDFLAHHEAEDCADAGHGLQQIQDRGVIGPGGLENWEFPLTQQLSVIGEECQIARAALGHRGGSEAGGAPARVAWEAIFLPMAGRLDGRWVCGTWARSLACLGVRGLRRRRRARVARISAG
jgi:hypothetical protein